MPRISVLIAALLTLVLAPAIPAMAQTSARTPISAYAAQPATEYVTLSDDGTELAYIHGEGDATQVVVQRRTGEIVAAIDVSDRLVTDLSWVSTDHVAIQSLVLNTQFVAGFDYLPQVDLVNVRNRRSARVLRDADRNVVNAVSRFRRGTWRGQPVLYVEATTIENHAYTTDVYRVDLDTGRGRRHATGADDTRFWMLRPDGQVAARIGASPDRGRFRLSVPSGGGWRTLYDTTAALDGPGVWGFGHDPDQVMISFTEDVTTYMAELSLTTGEMSERTPVPADITGPFYDRSGRLVGMGYEGADNGSLVFFEPKLEAAWNVLVQGLPGKRLRLASFDAGFDTVVVRSEGANDAGTYYLYDTRTRSVAVIGREYPAVRAEDVAPVIMYDYTAADGMEQFAYLTLPPGREAQALPVVLFPHGGPASRDHIEFDWWAQAMAVRGYAVVQPQFRGSDGFGEDYLRAGYGEWGRKMQTDLLDALKPLAEQGVIDLSRVCIVGASYGGYAALAGAAMHPDVYRCAISVSGVSDLPAMLESEARMSSGPDSRNPVIRYWNRFMGSESRNDTVLAALSPSRLAHAVRAPVLLIHGSADTIVPYDQSVIMERALRRAGKDVELVRLEGENHWLSYPRTRRQMLERLIAFLETHNPPD